MVQIGGEPFQRFAVADCRVQEPAGSVVVPESGFVLAHRAPLIAVVGA
jgi:hypothetical protein